jgi:thiamine transport system permease protein
VGSDPSRGRGRGGVRPRTRPGSDPGRLGRALTHGLPLAFLALFFLYPLAAIVERGLTSAGGSSALDVLGDPLTREVVWFTVWQALASTALTFAVALPAAYVLGRYTFPGRSLVRALVVVPFVLPTVVVALAFIAVLPEQLERGWVPILIAHAFFNAAVVVRVVGASWASLDRRTTEAAATLGAGPWRRFREVTLPQLAPALAAAAAIVFLFCFTSFGIVLILGGPRYATIEAEIYSQAVRLFDLRTAALLALVQLVFVAITVWIAMRLEARLAGAGRVREERDVLRRPRTVAEKLVVAGSLGGLGLFLGLPLAVLVERSLAVGEGHGLAAYRALGQPTSALLASPWEAIVNSLVFAAGATAIALVVGGLAAVAVASSRGSRLLDTLLMLPLGASAVMLGFGFVIAFDTAPLDIRAAPWIVPVAQALVAIPFVVRIVAPTLRAIDERQREAAAVLGASPGRVRREIDVPIAARALAVAACFAFSISLGEFGATVFLARPDAPTLPVAIFRFLGRPGELNVAQAYALAVILMAVTAIAILLVDRVRVRRGGWI